jgi:hypothetical protein
VFNDVVVGVDEQPGGRDAIALAKYLMLTSGELTLAHVHLGDRFARSSSVSFKKAERQRSRALLKAGRDAKGVETKRISIGSSFGRSWLARARRRAGVLARPMFAVLGARLASLFSPTPRLRQKRD